MATGNTTSLNMGPSGSGVGVRDFKDATARAISTSISKGNYQQAMKTDEKFRLFNQYVYAMVSKWSVEDKLNIISEYGDSAQLGNSPSEDQINRICTMSIIVNLNQADLEILVGDVKSQAAKLRGRVRKLNKRRSNLSISSFEDFYGELKDVKSTKEYKRKRQKLDRGFKVPRALQSQYRNLSRELQDVIESIYTNVIDITGLAMRMGIEIENGMPRKQLIHDIIVKTLLFVDLIVGKSKRVLSGAYMDPAPFEELLQYTSFAYVVGKPGMSKMEFEELARNARLAKKTIEERLKMTKQRKGTRSSAFGEVAGVRGSKRKIRKSIEENDTGLLADMDVYELSALAGKYGIDATKFKKNSDLKIAIYKAMAADHDITNKLERKVNKQRNVNSKTSRDLRDQLEVRKQLQYPSVVESSQEDNKSSELPIVTLNKRGEVQNLDITKAIAVYIVGQGPAGTQAKTEGSTRGEKVGSKILSSPGFGFDDDVIHDKRSGKGKGSLKPDEFYELSFIENICQYEVKRSNDEILDFTSAYIKGLKYPDEYESVAQLYKKMLSDSRVNKNTLVNIATSFADSLGDETDDGKRLNYIRRFAFQLLWIRASLEGKTGLAKYLDEKYGVAVSKYKNVAGKVGKVIRRGVIGGAVITGLGALASVNPLAAGYAAMALIGARVVVGAIKGVAKIVSAVKAWQKFINFSDLPSASQKNFQKFNQKDIEGLRNSIKAQLKNDATLDDFIAYLIEDYSKESKFQSQLIRWCFIAIAAKLEPDMPLYKHALWKIACYYAGGVNGPVDANALDIEDPDKRQERLDQLQTLALGAKKAIDDFYKDNAKKTTKINSFFKKIGFTLKNIFKKREDVIDTGEAVDALDDANSKNPQKNPGQRMPIPKINYLGEGKVNESDILEVVPVFVVNNASSSKVDEKELIDSKGKLVTKPKVVTEPTTPVTTTPVTTTPVTTTPTPVPAEQEDGYRKGLEGNADRVNKYKQDNNLGGTGKNNHVTFTKDAATIKVEMEKAGYNPVSKWITSGKGKIGKKYALKNQDLEWAIKNNFKFARGGYSFISGDSLTGRPNPEVVTINGNGEFSVRPLKSGPQNNYSEFAVDRYATGGTGLVDKLIKDPKTKLNEALELQGQKQSLILTARQLGLDPSEFGIMEAKNADALMSISRKLLKAFKAKQKESGEKEKDKREKGPEPETTIISTEAIAAGLTTIEKKPAIPVYVVNKDIMAEATDSAADWMASNLPMYFMGFSADVVAAPMGVGTIARPLMATMSGVNMGLAAAGSAMGFARDIASLASMNTGGEVTKANTGAKITRFNTGGKSKEAKKPSVKPTRFPTGGTMAITGDAAGPNMFANGAAPELVESNGDLAITPLNPLGKETKQKVSRMTSAERSKPLAVGVSSHVVAFKTKLPDSVSELSNAGEAIKVFNVSQQPGIYDSIDGNPSLYEMIAAIYGEISNISTNANSQTQLLGTIAKNTIPVSSGSGPAGGNPFAGGFPDSLNGILEGM